MTTRTRVGVAGLALSAAGFVFTLSHEGYLGTAYHDTVGVSTIGFGTTEGVKPGDKITPPKAVARAYADMTKYEGALKKCVHVPLSQQEYDVYIDFSYNVGSSAFCNSTLVKKLNALDYAGACKQILRWVKQPELASRRQDEYKKCTGETS